VADLLARRGDLFTGEYSFLQFGSLESLDLDYGINDDQWLSREMRPNEFQRREIWSF